jgi:hypothetical protein
VALPTIHAPPGAATQSAEDAKMPGLGGHVKAGLVGLAGLALTGALIVALLAAPETTPPASPSGGGSGARTVVGLNPAAKRGAGIRANGFSGDGGPALRARVARPTTVSSDRRGGFHFADTLNNRVRHVTAAGRISTVAGSGAATGRPGCAVNVPARRACLLGPHGVDVDDKGRLIIADTFNNRILRLDRDGVLRGLAGDGRPCNPAAGTCGEGGPPLRASLFWPTVAHQTSRGLVIADTANRILLVRNGRIRRIAGTGAPGFSGDGGPAGAARIWAPADAVPFRGGWLISDGNNCRLRWVSPDGIMRPFAGYGGSLAHCREDYATAKEAWGGCDLGDLGDGGPARSAQLSVTGFLAVSGDIVWVTDFLNNRLRQIRNGVITTVLGTGQPAGAGADGPVPGTRFRLGWPSGVARLDDGSLVVTDSGTNRIVRLSRPGSGSGGQVCLPDGLAGLRPPTGPSPAAAGLADPLRGLRL